MCKLSLKTLYSLDMSSFRLLKFVQFIIYTFVLERSIRELTLQTFGVQDVPDLHDRDLDACSPETLGGVPKDHALFVLFPPIVLEEV